MALLVRAAPVVGCGAVVSVLHHDAHGRAAQVAALLTERAGVECVTVADVAEARAAVAALPSPVVCAAVDRRGLAALRDVDANLVLVGPRCVVPSLDGELVVCLDGSTRAETVLPVARSWAAAFGLELWFVSAIASPEPSTMEFRSGDLLQSGYLAGVVAALGGARAVTGWDVLHGHPAAALVDHARHSRPAIVALNSHGASTATRTPWGRTPARVALECPAPVLLTRNRVEPLAPPVPRARPVPVPRRPVPRPVVVPLRVRDHDGDGLAVAARTFLSPSPLLATASRVRPRRSRRRAAALAVLLAAVFVVAAARAPLPYHRLGGGTRGASELVSVTGVPVDPSAGTILVPVVTAEPVTLAEVVGTWLGGTRDVRHDPDAITATTARWTSRRLMDTAGVTATAIALRHVGVDAAAVRVAITPRGLGGPSAGLAMALELVDLLSPGDLTRGHRVAVSGALAADGRVEPVGGMRYKVAAARRSGADVMLVPGSQARDASVYAGGVRIVAVASFVDALAALESLERP